MSKNTPSLGALIDGAYRLRSKRQEAQKLVNEIKSREDQVIENIMILLDDQNLSGSKGATASASISKSIVPTTKDWAKVQKYILRHKDLSLIEKRVSAVRYREILEENPRGVPGLEPFERRSLSLTKVGAK